MINNAVETAKKKAGLLNVFFLEYEIKNKQPKKFIRIAKDKNLELKAEIEEMVSAGVLRKIGNQVIFIDEVLGDTTEDAVVHLKDKKNSGKLTILRAKLKELSLV